MMAGEDKAAQKNKSRSKDEEQDDTISSRRLHCCRGLMVQFIFLPETPSPGDLNVHVLIHGQRRCN